MARRYGGVYLEACPKTRINADEIFFEIVRQINKAPASRASKSKGFLNFSFPKFISEKPVLKEKPTVVETKPPFVASSPTVLPKEIPETTAVMTTTETKLLENYNQLLEGML
jgi:hypothetical protein